MNRPTLRSILVASDLGPASDDVVRGAATLAARTGAELHMVHAVSGGGAAQGEQLLADQAARVAGEVRLASLTVVAEAAERAILERAATVRAELIVVGPHEGGGVGAHVLGTTAEHVIHEAQVPCLVVRGTLTVPLRRIGVPTDFSENARGAVDVALVLAGRTGAAGAEIRVFHTGWTVEKADDPQIERAELLPRLEREMAAAAARIGAMPEVLLHADVVWGVSPSETIVEYARRERLELLVLGTAGRGGIKRMLVGSVASGVARTAPCSVLLVPPALAAHITERADGR